MSQQMYIVVVSGQQHVIDLSPFGEDGAHLGATARAECCAKTLNEVQTLLAQSRLEHMRLKQRLLAVYKGKDSDAARKRYLEADLTYIDSRGTRDFLKDAHASMLYGHFPRLRDAEQHARQMELSAAQQARYRTP